MTRRHRLGLTLSKQPTSSQQLDICKQQVDLVVPRAGMTCMLPDTVLLAVCGVRGLGRVGREHLAVALALEVPLTVVVTKTDVAGRASVNAVVAEIRCSSV